MQNMMMAINQSLRDILRIIADLSHSDVNANILDTSVIDHSSLPLEEVNNSLAKLSSLGLIKMLKRTNNAENNRDQYYRLLNITSKGLQELSDTAYEE